MKPNQSCLKLFPATLIFFLMISLAALATEEMNVEGQELSAVKEKELAVEELTVYKVLELCEKNEVGEFSSIIKRDDYWEVKALNLNNQKECELLINIKTGIIDYCINVTPRDIVIGENTYGYSGKNYESGKDFYYSGIIVNGLKIYKNDSFYFRMKQGIFIKNGDEFTAYFMYKGPGLTKGRSK